MLITNKAQYLLQDFDMAKGDFDMLYLCGGGGGGGGSGSIVVVVSFIVFFTCSGLQRHSSSILKCSRSSLDCDIA